MTKRKNTDSSNYKYDMHDTRRAKRRKKVIQRTGALERTGTVIRNIYNHRAAGVRGLGGNSSRIIQGIGTASAAALGFITMNVPGAIIAGAYANEYLSPNPRPEYRDPETDPDGEPDYMLDLVDAALGSPKNNMPIPYYQGKFKAVSKYKKTKEDLFSAYGFYKVNEQYGTVNGSESLYIAANGFRMSSFSYTLAIAMLRKLFRLIGREINDANAPIVDVSASEMYKLTMYYETDAAGHAKIEYLTIADESLLSLAYNSQIVPKIEDYIQGVAGAAILTRIDLSIIDNVTTVTTPPDLFKIPRFLACLNLKNEKVRLYLSCSVVIQNRTKGASENSNNVDVVDSQPLKGYLYYFKKNTPQTKMQSWVGPPYTRIWAPFERTNTEGIMLINGNNAVDEAMKDPPTPTFFSNCSKASSVKLEPGAMKKFKVQNDYIKYYAEILRLAARFNGSVTYKRQNIADTMMIGLEEILNSGSANKITVQYEGENCTGAYFVTGPVPTMKKMYEQQNVNALDII